MSNPFDPTGYAEDVVLKGHTEELGAFSLQVTSPKGNRHPVSEHESGAGKPLDRTIVASYQAPDTALWQTKVIIFQEMKSSFNSLLEKYGDDDIPPPWQLFTLDNIDSKGAPNNLHLIQKLTALPADILTQQIEASSKDFNTRYKEIFKPNAPFDKPKYDLFSKSMFSNLLGGAGYFHGDQLIDRSYDADYDEDDEGFWEDAAAARARNQPKTEGPYSLFTAVPSRPFFPRGFLWDEGFHLLPIADWDVGFTLEVLKSWFATMDEDGWIPREQILGLEARSKVPSEFAVQYPHYANPPTLFTVIELLLDKVKSKAVSTAESESIITAFKSMYPLLKRNYLWYRKTQRGDIKAYDRAAFSPKEAYRWRGRTPTHILTSGLDDYPRAQPPHPGELHVDLISWMGLMARNMKRIAESLSEKDDAATFAAHETAITRNIDDLHWDPAAETFCDATVDEYEESVHECHKGYISVFPFLTGMLPPDSPRLGAVLSLLADPAHLWSPHGIRSLSAQDSAYATGEDYWRSPVWLNMNYLIVDNLLRVAQASGPHKQRATQLYADLRRNLVDTVYASWEATGFAWEQFNPDTGAGQRTQHFTGWTSLVTICTHAPERHALSPCAHHENPEYSVPTPASPRHLPPKLRIPPLHPAPHLPLRPRLPTPHLAPLLPCQPLLTPREPALPQPRQLCTNLIALERDLVGLLGARPEVGHAEAVVEVRAEVVHVADREEDVEAELGDLEVRAAQVAVEDAREAAVEERCWHGFVGLSAGFALLCVPLVGVFPSRCTLDVWIVPHGGGMCLRRYSRG
ncbi:hypothetical protein FH972_023661 [Carpinus fangiana]|uniref:Mannosyl-oligosaccharide glucosidase n=1 Tax=Carpinus fangiana TaxID=176857 RepID=A0A5N6KW79_9ROSI|nr:hypothetical protein FH972_023661 [Carpinus fangiana]